MEEDINQEDNETINLEDNETSLFTFRELQRKAKNEIKNKEILSNYLEAIQIYDVDPDINYSFLLLESKENYESFLKSFQKYFHSLKLEDRKRLINKIIKMNTNIDKIYLSKESNKSKYLDLIQCLKSQNLMEFNKLYLTTFPNQINHYKIPFIYGSEELRYAFLIHHLHYNIYCLRNGPLNNNKLGNNIF